MSKLSVIDYGIKFKFLVGHKANEPHGRLRDCVGDLLSGLDSPSQDQKWVQTLAAFVTMVRHYICACEAYADPTRDIQLSVLKHQTPELNNATHVNWTKDEVVGPDEEIGIAVAGLYGCGCSTDDPSLPIEERRRRWSECEDELWLSWQTDKAGVFIEKYTDAIRSNKLNFPTSVRHAMGMQSRVQSEQSSKPSPVWQRIWLKRGFKVDAKTLVFLGLLCAVTIFLLGMRSKPPEPLRGATTWVECLTEGNPVEAQTSKRTVAFTCGQTGLAALELGKGEVLESLSQRPFDVQFVPHALQGASWEKTIWRPSPSFSRLLTRRNDIDIALNCTGVRTSVHIRNDAWGDRSLSCEDPILQLPLLEPKDYEVSLTVKATSSTQTISCSGFILPFGVDRHEIDPSRPCEHLTMTAPPHALPRQLIRGLDFETDPSTGLIWLSDPFAFGSAWMWQSAAKWHFSELLAQVKDASGGENWRLAKPAEVIAADPRIFARANGASDFIEGIALHPDCEFGVGKLAMSGNLKVSNAEASASIAFACVFADPNVGFWIVRDP